MGLLGKVVNAVKDVGKILVQPVTSSISSITGKDINLKYDTKLGKAVGGTVKVGTDSVHIVGKTFADTVTGGYATKAANVIRKDEYKEVPGLYQEQKNQVFNSGLLSKFESGSEKGAVIVGSVASTLLKKKDPEPTNVKFSPPAPQNDMGFNIGNILQTVSGSIKPGTGSMAANPKPTLLGGILQGAAGVINNLVSQPKPVKPTADIPSPPQQLGTLPISPSNTPTIKIELPGATKTQQEKTEQQIPIWVWIVGGVFLFLVIIAMFLFGGRKR